MLGNTCPAQYTRRLEYSKTNKAVRNSKYCNCDTVLPISVMKISISFYKWEETLFNNGSSNQPTHW
jgi:hypothetical protein